ncbi:Gram-negative bacteria binding protein 2 precursor [Tribolium castaneum]|uniref:Gram-negative bacteria binding protein 2 n=1 Tax=Tribolium castaneum TaxID=7070 RepID=D6W6B8_TRICA|nr:Gram-negative bacteria binding protein 2 precursor [Tribolium castaneum]EFA11591.1 Gram-negative bacteria binding protein 2 [Tribolium castaneum]|eukprot:NP_001164284.1 Gram-negative bacteria binding protein 2 precursor [Tribolium castaneum]
MFVKGVVLLLFLSTQFLCYEQFVIPDVTLEAYAPKGFRASIPALPGIQMFAFHMNVNKKISQVDPGDYRQDYTSPDGNVWSYFNSDLSLNIGDTVNYWIFVQHEKLGYRKDNVEWTVTELLQLPNGTCEPPLTVVSGQTQVCKGQVVFEENFRGDKINENKWTLEQYIPTYTSVDSEFVSYQKKQCYIFGEKLFIKPNPAQNDDDVNGELDFRGKCTRATERACHIVREIYLIVPPVASGRIVSKFKFRYGTVEIKAKLPAGDWIYPQIYLEKVSDPKDKIWISYARGNNQLLLKNKQDLGGNLLFGGLVIDPEEPGRSQFLKTKRSNTPFSREMHVYTVIWTKDKLSLLLDGTQYGEIDKEALSQFNFSDDDLVQIVLGVGVGGNNDFPDSVQSGNHKKPWVNKDPKEVKFFFNARSEWLGTWKGDNTALQVDYVKVTAL